MYPELWRIPLIDFPIYSYGVLLALGIWLGIWLAARLAAADGLDRQKVIGFALRVAIASLVGAKLLLIITEWRSVGSLREVFSLDLLRAGGVYYGGFLAGLATAVALIWAYRWPGWKVADAFAPSLAIGQSLGRLGCFAAGCCWGKPTSSWVGVTFPVIGYEHTGVPAGIALHPTQLYEAGATLGIFLFLLWLRRRRAFAGQVVLVYILLYAVARFIIEFYRDDWRGWVGPLSTSQFIAVCLAGASLLVLAWRKRMGRPMRLRASDSSAS